jgi:glutamate formiminotransferase
MALYASAGAFFGLADIRLPPQMRPDYGPGRVDTRSGVATVGASPWIVNYNVLLATGDMEACRRVARAVSGRGGGLPRVEAMALPHREGAGGISRERKHAHKSTYGSLF